MATWLSGNRALRRFLAPASAALALLVGLLPLADPSPSAAPTPALGIAHAAERRAVQAAYARLPLHFEANAGQADPRVQFLARGAGYTVFLTADEAVFSLRAGPARVKERAPADDSTRPPSARPDEAKHDVLRFQLVGAEPVAVAAGLELLPGKANYFLGNDPTRWRTDVPTYARVRYADAYPGIDLIYYGSQGRLEHDFVVAPGADPRAIQFRWLGATGLTVDAAGDLLVETSGGTLRQRKPVVYQETDGGRREIASHYVLHAEPGGIAAGQAPSKIAPASKLVAASDSEEREPAIASALPLVSFALGAYDTSLPLVIDPVIAYGNYLGGSGPDQATAVAVDTGGSAYVTGQTTSVDFPAFVGSIDPTCGTDGQCTMRTAADAFVAKFTSSGNALLYATYLGGSEADFGLAIAVDSSSNAYVTGETLSPNFPTTTGAFDRVCGTDGTCNDPWSDVFVAKLNPTGSALVYSTFLGGSETEQGFGISVDAAGSAYVAGQTFSLNFPTTAGAFDTTPGTAPNAFVTKLNAAGSALVYSTYLGGTAGDMATALVRDFSGNVYVTGRTFSTDFPTTVGAFDRVCGAGTVSNCVSFEDAFVTKLNATGTALVYSTYLGGSNLDRGQGIAVDSAGNAYVTGETRSASFPTTAGAFHTSCGRDAACDGSADAFVTKLNAAGTALEYSTFLGGGRFDAGTGIAVDAGNQAHVTGFTLSDDFPTTPNPIDGTCGGATSCQQSGSQEDAFVVKLNNVGNGLVYSTFLGGNRSDRGLGIAVDGARSAYVVGRTNSVDFPASVNAADQTCGTEGTCNGGFDDAFVVAIYDGQCVQRPNVGLSVAPGAPGRLNVQVQARTVLNNVINRITRLEFGAATGAFIENVPGGPASSTGNFTVNVQPGTTQVNFVVRQATAGQAATVPLVVTDGCGPWPTFVGGGPGAFGGGGSGAQEPTPGSTVPMPAPSPTPMGSAPLPPTCAPRPRVDVATSAVGRGRLQATITAASSAHVELRALRFTVPPNALVDVADRVGATGDFTVNLPPGTVQTTVSVRAASSGQAVTVPLTVVDSCGDWPTIVGGGAATTR